MATLPADPLEIMRGYGPHLSDMAGAKARTGWASAGDGPDHAAVIRGFLADGTGFVSAKAAASYAGLNSST